MWLYELFLKHPSVQTDSRKVKEGDLFFALKGLNFNGNEFAAEALEKGAAYAIVDEKKYAISDKYILEDDALLTLQQLARYHRLQFNIPFIAITGSNGKTTTKELMAAVLSEKYKVYATRGNLNNHIGIPLTLLEIKSDVEIAIIEMGANHQNEIDFYCEMALPNFGVITNCGKAHLEGFGSEEGVRKAKGELYDYIRMTGGTIFKNSDLGYLDEMAQGIDDQVTYGTGNAKVLGRSLDGGAFLNVAVLSTGLEMQIRTQLVGNYNLPNVLAAVAVGNYFEVDPDGIRRSIEAYGPSNSRSQLIHRGRNQIILDAYNANPTSMRAAIENLSKSNVATKWVFLGGMKELGAASIEEHQEIVKLLELLNFENVLLTGAEFEAVAGNFKWFPNVEALGAFLANNPISDSLILIKGSRASKMELILEAF